ncbi:Nuclear matrix constituent protein 1 [Labeo rohita]|uniref:Nuclear matrix constituent protein 1 n=1 Tax=Labeo rohita TaxID=84645 RepID=A0ABQ8M972_LABRO|nr:Nuclear matrix constituent protein 1 [Labeo rohita]
MQSVLLKAPVCVCWCDSKGHGHSVLGKSSGNTELLLLKNRSDLAEVTRSPKIWDSCQDTPQDNLELMSRCSNPCVWRAEEVDSSPFFSDTSDLKSIMTSSKSSQTTRNIVIACLALWSIISLIIIVVWATSPEMKGASQCRTEMQALRERHEGAKVVWNKDRKALEELVRQGWRNQTALQKQIDEQKNQIQSLNVSLNTSQQENAILNENITILQGKIEQYKIMEENLTAEVTLQKDQIEALEHNLTLKAQELASCEALRIAAKQLQTAAEKQKQACETTRQYLQKQLMKCKEVEKHENEPEHEYHLELNDSGGQGITMNSVTLAVIGCLSLLLRRGEGWMMEYLGTCSGATLF